MKNIFFIFTVFVCFSLQLITVAAVKLKPDHVKSSLVENKSMHIMNKSNHFYFRTAQKAFKQFQLETFKTTDLDLDLVFLKIEKKIIYQDIKPDQLTYFQFGNLTNSVFQFAEQLKNNLKMSFDPKQRSQMQKTFFGLSQAIKKANQMNLTIQSDQFDKLHDILMSQATSLFYVSYKERRRTDLFWCAYFLHELSYPMDLTAKHLIALEKSMVKSNDIEKYKNYGARLAKLSLGLGQQLTKSSAEQIDFLYKWTSYSILTVQEQQAVQRAYLKQIQILGDSEKIKDFKKELATGLLYQESKNLLKHPLSVFKYIQFLIGYIFVAWPLEFILILGSLSIFAVQASSVLTKEEKKKARRLDKKLWMMFTKSYLGANVPFFSKLAASLILFGVGLYFNSAKNFVESMISSM